MLSVLNTHTQNTATTTATTTSIINEKKRARRNLRGDEYVCDLHGSNGFTGVYLFKIH